MAKPNPQALGVRANIGNRAGHGQDNAVYELRLPDSAEKLEQMGRWVIKVSNENLGLKPDRQRSDDPNVAASRGTLYKRNKYDILKHFLGDHIPESMFLASSVQRGERRRSAELTIQRRVPQLTLDMLDDKQRQDPRLSTNLLDLVQGMQRMYSVIGEVNGRTASSINLDAKLDLGGISDYVKSESLDHKFDEKDMQRTIQRIKSPNLLVNPADMQVYCIDFDQGEWVPGMDEAKAMVFAVDALRQSVQASTRDEVGCQL